MVTTQLEHLLIKDEVQVSWLIGQLVGWLVGRLVGLLVGWLMWMRIAEWSPLNWNNFL